MPVSVVAIEPNTVTLLRTPERDGYSAVQVGAGTAKKLTKPRLGQLKGLPRVRDVREFRLEDVAGLQRRPDARREPVRRRRQRGHHGRLRRARGSRAPSSGTTSAVVPRPTARTRIAQPGSIGGGTTPGKVFKGTRMAGRMGGDQVTVKKATIVRADAERNVLLVKGPVPGARNALIVVRKA